MIARIGSPIFAAESGVVIYSGNGVSGYGNLVILKHSKELSTVYAHNKKNLVKKGDLVKRGEKIALLGNTGKSTGAHLHFEVRVNKKAVNPIRHLVKK
jgi:murein DD-endopeptidase MepM/ murein hydrolase activator NlpD